MVDDVVQIQLAEARKQLIDLTMRNRLLNFLPTKRQTIRIVDEVPNEVWKLLVSGGKKLGFLAREDHELFDGQKTGSETGQSDNDGPDTEYDQEELFGLPSFDLQQGERGGDLPGRYRDSNLQTALGSETLQTNLLRIYQSANSVLQERGVNFLFLAMGFLEWKQPETHGDQTFKAPILLIPVGLERTSARSRFKLFALEEEPVANPCLSRKLEDLRISIPAVPEEWSDLEVSKYLDDVRSAVKGQPGWAVADDMYLGLFSFTKYLMYLDLDTQRWPKETGISNNPLVRGLCGDGSALASEGELPCIADVDKTRDPKTVYQVLDADSSQQVAILYAQAGHSFVIEGPPGTGKSQTIANIIAECLARNKTVLFVSEKMAALEVVKSRLDKVGLGDFVLELHSTKANRKMLTAELERILEAGRPRIQAREEDAQKLQSLKNKLNEYAKAMHEPYGAAKITPFEAIGKLLLLKDVPNVPCNMPGYEKWSKQQMEELKDEVSGWSKLLAAVWPPSEHPWKGARITVITSQVRNVVFDVLKRLLEGTTTLLKAVARLSGAMDVAVPNTIQSIAQLRDDVRLLLKTPGPDRRLLDEGLWNSPPKDELEKLVGALKSYVALREDLSQKYKLQETDSIDWAAMLGRRKRLWGSIGRVLCRSYWRDRACVRHCREDGRFPSIHEATSDLDQLVSMYHAKDQLEASKTLGEQFFGSAWHGVNSRLDAITFLAEWLPRFHKCFARGGIGTKAVHLAESSADRTEVTLHHQELEQIVRSWEADLSSLQNLVQADENATWGSSVGEVPLAQVRDSLQRMAEGMEMLVDWSRYQDGLQVCEKGPLAEFVSEAVVLGVQPDVMAQSMEKLFLDKWLNDVLAQRPEIRRFNARTHETDQYDFARLDKLWIEQSGARLHAYLAAQRPANSDMYAESSQMGIVCGEIRRKRGGKSIRRLLLDAKDAIQRIKPCFMMSPLSVAQFIDPAGMKFDVVVFDEASQVEPPDALGAIARGKQLILVGDPKQLPPTRFFAGLTGEGDPQDSDKTAGIADMESILDKGLSVLPKTTLRWHYRSKHESLIAFSNREFYNNKLVVFPSSHRDKRQVGLSLEYVSEDTYDRGKSQTNRGQARRIAKYVLEHARYESGKSLGVGAFSQRQQQAILDEIERLRRSDGSTEEFFGLKSPEAFFVKNLETIQGDERDVILLSVGYGRTVEDRRISMNFGPLNQDGGWRRLNVLVTRAREKCVVFSSILGDDLDVSGTLARGVHALKGYLDYARTGQLPEIEVGAQGDFDSDFEQAVYNALVEKGLTLHTQVGCAGYAIDLAVVDPEKPGRYLLGIECDGATYHASQTARDRDRLRQQVLEGLGWRIHRVWSTEWFNKPQSEVERVVDAVQKAQAGLLKARYVETSIAAAPPALIPPSKSEAVRASEIAPEVLAGIESYKCYVPQRIRSTDAFYAGTVRTLAELVRDVVTVEGPIHEDELARRITACHGMVRVGNKIAARVQDAARYASSQYGVVCRGKFLWPASMAEPCIRSRSSEGPRDIELICPEEIGIAARLLLEAQFGMNRRDLVVQTARVFGFSNTGSTIAAAVESVLDREIAAGRIRADADSLVVDK